MQVNTPRYTLHRRIGQGGWAEVWEATDALLCRQVAVKLFIPGGSDISSALDHARALARVTHINVVQVYDVCTILHPEEGEEWNAVVMELLEGPALLVLVESQIPPATAEEISLGVFEGLRALHAAGVVHSDLHGGNIVLHKGVPKLLDAMYRGTLVANPPTIQARLRRQDILNATAEIATLLTRSGRHDIAVALRRQVDGNEQVSAEQASLFLKNTLAPSVSIPSLSSSQLTSGSALGSSAVVASQGENTEFEVIGFSRNKIGGQHDFGILRVGRFRGEAKAHAFTARGWDARALDKEAESIIYFILSMRSGRRSLESRSVDAFPQYYVSVRVSIAGQVTCEWSTLNDVGERIFVEADTVPLTIRCDLLAACAVLPDE